MGKMYPEPKRPQKKANVTRDLMEAMGVRSSISALICVKSDKKVLAFDGSHYNPLYGESPRREKYVKCEYCESELEDKYINCPNCGAPLKRR